MLFYESLSVGIGPSGHHAGAGGSQVVQRRPVENGFEGGKKPGKGWGRPRKKSRAITVSDLLKIRKKLAEANWGSGSRQSIWTCCLIVFFGSNRLSELLGDFAGLFGSKSALCWKNVIWVDENHVQIDIRISKTNQNSETVDLFVFPKKSLCPVRALKKLEISQKLKGL